MRTSSVLLTVVSLLAGTAILAGAEGGAGKDVHRGTGIVIALSPSEIALREGEGPHRMAVDLGTRILIVPDDRVRELGVGDYVAEECVSDGKGGARAITLNLYRPAWMENASPEN